tara:strand:- start:295 stop:519 length:225 start_codon:yes stop_codon:yes gene_type:complete
MSLKLQGATNGSVELDVPATVGANLQITIPATAGTIAVLPTTLVNAPTDADASTAGVPVGGLYRNGSILMIRVS